MQKCAIPAVPVELGLDAGVAGGARAVPISLQDRQDVPDPYSLAERFCAVRAVSVGNCEPLEPEDYCIQPMADASPPKWHLAHVTWFFETFLLKPFLPGYAAFHPCFEYLFNSYYQGVGTPFPRTERGRLSRPTTAEVLEYRAYVDAAMLTLLSSASEPEIAFRTELGLHHEQQHQELFFTDMKFNLGNNPLRPVYVAGPARMGEAAAVPLSFVGFQGGIHEIGHAGDGFHFDNEGPRHEVLLRDFELANRPVTNGEYLAFMADDGYGRAELWLSDGWAEINASGVSAPQYWYQEGGDWYEYHLDGARPLCLAAPVCHVSGYEAAAYARWARARLPREPEWEVAAAVSAKGVAATQVARSEVAATAVGSGGNFVETGLYRPVSGGQQGEGLQQMFGDVWEWTSSAYAPYPGFQEFDGSLGEYNGKFMANQLVLRGGSCVTPASHIRTTYRNFFYPKDRWQFSGIRLARD